MEDVIRYDFGEDIEDIEESADGDYVEYNDYKALLKQLEDQKTLCDSIVAGNGFLAESCKVLRKELEDQKEVTREVQAQFDKWRASYGEA